MVGRSSSVAGVLAPSGNRGLLRPLAAVDKRFHPLHRLVEAAVDQCLVVGAVVIMATYFGMFVGSAKHAKARSAGAASSTVRS